MNETPNRRAVLAGMAGTVGLLAGCTGSEADSGNDSESSDDSEDSDENSEYDVIDNGVVLTEIEVTDNEYGNVLMTGLATNTTDRALEYVQIEVVFFNSYDEQIGSSMANTNNLMAGGQWRWEAMYMSMDTSDVAGASVVAIQAY